METRRCPACMTPTQATPCHQCGFDPVAAPQAAYALPYNYLLKDRYRLGKVLGQDTLGIAYVAWDEMLNQKVAVKEYYPGGHVMRTRPDLNGSLLWGTTPQANELRQSGMNAFIQEAQKMARVQDNPEVPHVTDIFYGNETVYFVMDLVEGRLPRGAIAPMPQQPAYQVPQQPVYQPQQPVYSQPQLYQTPKKPRVGLIIGIVSAVVLLIIGLTVCVTMLLTGKRNTTKTPQWTPASTEAPVATEAPSAPAETVAPAATVAPDIPAPTQPAVENVPLVNSWFSMMNDTEEEALRLLQNIDAYDEEIELMDLTTLTYCQYLFLNSDGTYDFVYAEYATWTCTRDFFELFVDTLYENRTKLESIYATGFADMSKADFREFYAGLYNYADFDTFLDALADNAYDYESLATPWESGTYYIEDDKIWMTMDGDTDALYVTYELDGDLLTLYYTDAVEYYVATD